MWRQTVRKQATHRNYFFGVILIAVTLFAYQPAWQGKPILDDFIHLLRPQNRSQAIATAHRGLDAANQRGMRPLADQLGAEIALYELGIPYRETRM